MRGARVILSWAVYAMAVVIALPSLIGIHVATVLGDISDDIYE